MFNSLIVVSNWQKVNYSFCAIITTIVDSSNLDTKHAEIKRAKRLFYSTTVLWSAFFATGNWLFFWRLYLTNGGIGLVDAICFTVGMIAQVPTGAIADKIGRRRTMILGATLMGVGYGATGFAINGAGILAGYLIYSIGASFYSGADDALMYDYLKARGCEKDWEAIIRRKQIIRRVGNLTAVFIGGYLYAWNVRMPSIVRGLFFLMMITPLLKMKFMDKTQPFVDQDLSSSYGRHIWLGMRELLNKKMLPVVLLIVFVEGTAVIFISGILRPLMLEKTGISIVNQSNFIALIQLVVVFLLYRKIKNHLTPFRRVIMWSSFMVTGFIFNIPAKLVAVELVGIALIHVGYYLIIPAMSQLLNETVSSKHRATALSTANLLEQVPYIFAAPLIGLAADKNQVTLVVEILAACLLVIVLLAAFFRWVSREKTQIINNEAL